MHRLPISILRDSKLLYLQLTVAVQKIYIRVYPFGQDSCNHRRQRVARNELPASFLSILTLYIASGMFLICRYYYRYYYIALRY